MGPKRGSKGLDTGEREFEVGKDASYFAVIQNGHTSSQDHYDELKQISTQALQNAVSVAHQVSMNNADTANLTAKQAVAHRDLATNAEWTSSNELETGIHGTTAEKVYRSSVTADVLQASVLAMIPKMAEAMAPMVAKAVADGLKTWNNT